MKLQFEVFLFLKYAYIMKKILIIGSKGMQKTVKS